MSQNDFVIANQTAPNFRADLNLALQALASTSSGATAPSTTYANMLWYDTANNILKMRTEADDAWIDLGTLDQSANTFTPAGQVTFVSGGTTQATTSGTSITQEIPSGVTEITVCFDNVQTSGFARFAVQIGTASTLQTTGYDTISVAFNSGTTDITKDSYNDTLGFYPLSGTVTGIVTLVKIAGTTNKWMATSNVATTAVGNSSAIGSGVVTLGGEVDIVGITTRLGDTFSSGNIHINWKS